MLPFRVTAGFLRSSRPPQWFSEDVRLTVFGLLFLVILGWFGLTMVERQAKEQMGEALVKTLEHNTSNMDFWIEERKRDLQSWASETNVRHNILSLLAKVERENQIVGQKLLNTPETAALRGIMRPLVRRYGFTGYVLFDRRGRTISALLDEPVLNPVSADHYPFLERVWRGETTLSIPGPGEVPLPTLSGEVQAGWPTMFFATPVRDGSGRIIAAFAFRVKPEAQFSQILVVGRIGKSGESYAFDRNGKFITESRFTAQLAAQGLLPKGRNTTAILQLEARAPQEFRTSSPKAAKSAQQPPLTLAADGAIRGDSGVNVDGYLNYRGVMVVGAWTWLSKHDFGLVAEQEVMEAYAPLQTLKRVFMVIFGLLAVIVGLALLLKFRQTGIERLRYEAERSLLDNEQRMRAVVNNAQDAIITIDRHGIVETYNPSAERIFGYKADEIIGKSINLLMPEPYRSEHDEHIRRYLATKESRVLGILRELVGQRKDGTVFPLELSASEMRLEDRVMFIGTLRDITQRKRAEEDLRRETANIEMVREIAMAANLAGTIDEIFNICLDKLTSTFGWPVARARRWQQQPAGAKEGILSYWRLADSAYEPVREHLEHLPEEKNTLCEDVRRSGAYVWRNFKDAPDFFSAIPAADAAHRLRTGLAFPALVGDEVVAIIELYSPEELRLDNNFVQPLFNIGAHLGRVIERKRALKNLQQYTKNLERTNQELLDFTFVASHDLQEPLRKVTSFAGLLRASLESQLNEKSNDYFERMLGAINRMHNFINDFLVYSRITSTERQHNPIPLSPVLKEVLIEIEDSIQESGAEILVGEMPCVSATPLEMRHLFLNLIGNSIKYRREGVPPRITISAAEAREGFVEVAVEDNGIGFDEKYCDRIFKPFQRLHKNEYPGTGMGLAICQKIVQRMDGAIGARSRPGEGSTFFVRLPVNHQA